MTLISQRDRAADVCEQNHHARCVDPLCCFSDRTRVKRGPIEAPSKRLETTVFLHRWRPDLPPNQQRAAGRQEIKHPLEGGELISNDECTY